MRFEECVVSGRGDMLYMMKHKHGKKDKMKIKTTYFDIKILMFTVKFNGGSFEKTKIQWKLQ